MNGTQSASDSVTTPTRAERAAGMAAYQEEGQRLATEIGNRGRIRLTDDGRLHPDILAAHWRQGFYVFEGLIDGDKLAELRRDANEMLERAPVSPDADVVFLMSSMCRAMPSGLRLYGHPHLLVIAAAINGDDFVPFNDAIFVKQPGLGGSVSWHQDGVTHWGSPDWDEGIHGFNFQVQLYPTTPASCLWVAPGTHKLGKIDIEARVRENGGSEQLPGALPLVCDARRRHHRQPPDAPRLVRQQLAGPAHLAHLRLPPPQVGGGTEGRARRRSRRRSSTTPSASSIARR